jgi:hypothetical protein
MNRIAKIVKQKMMQFILQSVICLPSDRALRVAATLWRTHDSIVNFPKYCVQSQPLLVRAQLKSTGAKYRISKVDFTYGTVLTFLLGYQLVTSLSFVLYRASASWILGFPLARRLTSDPEVFLLLPFRLFTRWLPLGNFFDILVTLVTNSIYSARFFFQISSAPSVSEASGKFIAVCRIRSRSDMAKRAAYI